MTPGKFMAFQERRIGRALTGAERASMLAARELCSTGKRDSVKAMWKAARALGL